MPLLQLLVMWLAQLSLSSKLSIMHSQTSPGGAAFQSVAQTGSLRLFRFEPQASCKFLW